MRLAGIDCGTNSIRLLIADVVDGSLRDVDRRMEIVRLGEGVDATGVLSAAALGRTFDAAQRYARLIDGAGAAAVRFVATSASRDAANAQEFADGIEQRLGVRPEVISGAEEARLSFLGATRSLVGLPKPTLVVDIGGGSTEFVLGSGSPTHSVSVDMGCVRMAERYLRSDPPAADEVAAVRRDAERLLDQVARDVPLDRAASLAGLAGTATTVAAMALGLPAYDSAAIHGSRISAQAVSDVAAQLAGMSHAQRAALPFMHPGRVDVIVSGAAILDAVVQRVGLPELIVSEHDILDGIVWSLSDGGPAD